MKKDIKRGGVIFYNDFSNCLKCGNELYEYFRRDYFTYVELWKRCPQCRKVYQFKIKKRRNIFGGE